MNINRQQLQEGVAKGIISPEQAEDLWALWQSRQHGVPRFDFTHILYYLGGLLAIGAMTLFMNLGWERFGGWGIVALCLLYAAAGLWLLPELAIGWTLLFGFGSGATMILGLTFIGLRASSAHQAAALSGMAQSVGYLLAACGPPLMGRIHDANGDWHIPLLAVALISLVMAVCGALAGRDREIHP